MTGTRTAWVTTDADRAGDQFVVTHGTDAFVVIIDVVDESRGARHHVFAAADQAAADLWVGFWQARGGTTRVVTMADYIGSKG